MVHIKSVMKDLFIAVAAAVVAGLILSYLENNDIFSSLNILVIVVASVLVGICIYLSLFVFRCRSHGIIKILGSSVKGEGSTASYMSKATHSICFVGIAASKWVNNADLLEKTIRSICSLNSGYIKFLLLNPNSQAVAKLSLAQESHNDDDVKKKIENALNKLQEIIARLSQQYPKVLDKFEIRLYDQMPVYRLTILDNNKAYFCFYQRGCDGSKLKQFLINQCAFFVFPCVRDWYKFIYLCIFYKLFLTDKQYIIMLYFVDFHTQGPLSASLHDLHKACRLSKPSRGKRRRKLRLSLS